MKESKKKKLTDKEERFCQEYIIDLNGTQAATRAKYSKKTARQIATNLLSKVYIQDRIAELQKEKFEQLNMDQNRAFQEMIKDRTYDAKDFFELREFPIVVNDKVVGYEQRIVLKSLDQIDGTLISEIRNTQHGVAIKLPDRQKALDQIAKRLGMFIERHEHSGPDGEDIRILKVVRSGNGRNGN